jgi:uncharacterized protein (TIGR01777 family)
MNITLTGATGRIGTELVKALRARGDRLTVLSRSPDAAADKLGPDVEAIAWDPAAGPAPASALNGRDAVVHLAGEDVGQRWNAGTKQAIRDSRETGTRNLVAGLRGADPRPKALVAGSATGFYGPRGDEPVDETAAPGGDFLAQVCVAWEREANAAREIGLRVVNVRTGVVLTADSGALAKMLPPFRAGLGGPTGGGKQYMPWIHLDDEVGILIAALDNESFDGPVNAAAPQPATNREFAKALGRALGRPAVLPTPGFAIRAAFGEMSQIVLTGVRAVPGRAGELGYTFQHPEISEALSSTLGR